MRELSVIIIGRNEAARIEKCLRSVFASLEGLVDYEVIYVDSASEDDTVKIAGRFPVQILQLRRDWKLTPSAGRYIGYRHASGRFLAFVDGDTVLHPGWLAESCAFLRDNPEYGGVAGILDKACLMPDGDSTIIERNHYEQTAQHPVKTVGSLGGIATYRREAMERSGTFNPFLPTGEECEVALRIRKTGYKLARIYTPMCVAHTLPPESIPEIVRRARAHLYDYGTPLRYCLTNGFGLRFSMEQMPFVYTFVAAVVAFIGALVVSLLTGATWLLAVAAVLAASYLALKRRHPKYLAISVLKRTIITYRTLVSFIDTKVMPIESYPKDVIVVPLRVPAPTRQFSERVRQQSPTAQTPNGGPPGLSRRDEPAGSRRLETASMHLGIIASMKMGLGQFIYRELCGLAGRGARISLFPTKHRPGLYNPRPEWNVDRWRPWWVVLSQPLRFLIMPVRYCRVLLSAIRQRAIVDFLLAAYFAPHMRDIDVIYSTFGDRKLFVGYFCKRLLDKPLAVEIHAHELYVNPNPKLFRVALAACDEIITVSEYNRELLAARFGIPQQRVEVVRLSVDLDEYHPAKKFVILIVAFFVERKGHEILLQAVKKLGNDDIEVWVVGGADAEENATDVPAMARQLGLESQVAFFGKLSGAALRAVYHACDVFCLPCRHDSSGNAEGFPTVLIEAMACGKPVVTTKHVEIPRIVEQIVVEENDVDALADALQRVYASAALRERLGRRNRELAEMHFSPENVGRTMELLRRIAPSASDRAYHDEVADSAAAVSEIATNGRNGQPGSNPESAGSTESVRPPLPERRPAAKEHSGAPT